MAAGVGRARRPYRAALGQRFLSCRRMCAAFSQHARSGRGAGVTPRCHRVESCGDVRVTIRAPPVWESQAVEGSAVSPEGGMRVECCGDVRAHSGPARWWRVGP